MRTWLGQGCLDSLIRALPCSHRPFLAGLPRLPVFYVLSSGWIWGFRRASATGGPRTLTGSSHFWKGVGHSWQGGLAPTVRPGEADLGFQKGLSDWGAQNLERFQPILEEGRPLPAGGSPLLRSSAGPGPR